MKQKRKHRIEKYLEERIFLTVGICLFLVVLFVIISLFSFQRKAYEREYLVQIDAMEDLAAQGSTILEERLKGYLHVVSGLSELFREGEIHSEKKIGQLKRVIEKEGLDFQRMGIADVDGASWLTNGDKINVKDSVYFKQALQGESVVTESFVSRVANTNVFIVAVPIFDEAGGIKGVLYGVVEVEKFHIYDDTSLENFLRYIRVIDREGTYLVGAGENEGEPSPGDNLYEVLLSYETDIPVEEVTARVKNGEHLIIEAKNKKEEVVACFAPLSVNQWYVVTVMDKKDILSRVTYILGTDIYLMIFQVIVAFAVVCTGIAWYLWSDKKYIETLYNQMKINDEMIRTAISTAKSSILFYDAEKDQLKIIGGKEDQLLLPSVVESASKTLVEHLPFHEQTREQVEAIFKGLAGIKENENFEISIEVDGSMRTYMVHVVSMEEKEKKAAHYVGIVDDITEKVFLEREMKLQEGLFSGMVGFLVVDLDEDRILRCSKSFYGRYEAKEPYSRTFETMMKSSVVEEYQEYLTNSVSPKQLLEMFKDTPGRTRVEYPYRKKDGNLQWMECDIRAERAAETNHCLAYIVLRDISEKKNAEYILREQADKDYLTGLFNRRSAVEKIDQLLLDSGSGRTHAFMILDLDNFKAVNDNLGHQTGDKALIDVAHILLHHFRKYDIVCRLAGDEFVVFMKDIPLAVIEGNIRSLLKNLHLTYTDGKTEVAISASAGVAVWPSQGADFAALYQIADRALYEAKEAGKQTYRIYR